MFTGMILIAAILKIIFHHLHWLARLLPESCVLIVVGIITAVFIDYVILDEFIELKDKAQDPFPKFTSTLFFNVLLPPIILDSALALYDKDFFENFFSIMIFAVFGTLFNVFTIGYSLFALADAGLLGQFAKTTMAPDGNTTVVFHQLAPTECLIFSSLISAVDPVAVLAIFEEIHVNQGLYFLVFGESLFNDGVTVVLYNTMQSLLEISVVGVAESLLAVLSFFLVAGGGALIGFLSGLFASYITKYTEQVRVVEPLIIFSAAYFSFLMAELVHWSGIISMIAFGICVKRYGFSNLSKKSYTTVKYAIKTLASTSDCIIFLFLGVVLIQESHDFHTGFILATIVLCFIYRFLGTFLLSALVNLRRIHKIDMREQIIMGYGGLRGAVGFSLAVVLSKDVWYRELFVSAALAMVFFTVFLQGSTIKLLVKVLDIKLSKAKESKLCTEIQVSLIDEMMEGVGIIVGRNNRASGLFIRLASMLDDKLKAGLCVEKTKELLRKYEKIMLDEHFTNLYAPRILAQQTEEENQSAPLLSVEDTRKSLKKGLRGATRDRFKDQMDIETPDLWSVASQLELRKERAMSMEDRVLPFAHQERGIANGAALQDEPEAGEPGRQPLARSTSVNWASLRRAGRKAAFLKLEYDRIQREKLVRTGTPKVFPREHFIMETEEDEGEQDDFIKKVRYSTVN